MLNLYLSMIENPEDQLRFEDFFNKYNEEIKKYALALIGNYYDAEDITQDAWLAIAQNFDKFHAKSEWAIKAYLFKTVKYMSLDRIKENDSKEKKIMGFDTEEIESKQDLYDTTLFEICQNETYECVLDSIKCLEETYRDVLTMYYFCQSSTREISKVMQINEQNVRKHLERGRIMLIKLLAKRGEICSEKKN